MPRYIDIDPFMEELNDMADYTDMFILDIRERLEEIPTVDVPDRKVGKWVCNIHDLPICDQCGYMTPYDRAIDDYEYGNFCPNCGARMKGEKDANDL